MTRFWDKVAKSSGCWVWTAHLNNKGYGQFGYGGKGKKVLAHRFAYQIVIGEIPKGLELDHLCRNPACVRPDHLEPVTHAENLRRGSRRGGELLRAIQRAKSACPRGHAYGAANSQGKRECRTCRNATSRAKRAAYRAANPLPPKTHCIRGHEFTPDNTYVYTAPGGTDYRLCRACAIMRSVAAWKRKRDLRDAAR